MGRHVWEGDPMRIFGQTRAAVGPRDPRSGLVRAIRKGGRWPRRAAAVLAVSSAGALLMVPPLLLLSATDEA